MIGGPIDYAEGLAGRVDFLLAVLRSAQKGNWDYSEQEIAAENLQDS